MKKYLFAFVFLYISNASFSQVSATSPIEIPTKNPIDIRETKTLKISMAGYSKLNFESLKSELIAWKEKVKSIDINENTKEFTLVHFTIMDNRELHDVLNKYNIQKNAIISYQ